MEASQATTDGAVEGQQEGAEGAEQQEGQQEQVQPDYTPIFEHLDRIGENLEQRVDERMQALQPPPAPEPDPVEQRLEQLYQGDEEPDPAQARQVLREIFRAEAEQQYGPQMQQMQEQVETLRQERAADEMFAEIPELKNEKTLEGAWNDAFDLAMQITQGNEQQAQWLANQPHMIKTAYLAGVARQRAEDERSSGNEQEVELESAGAAHPGQADPDDEIRRAIRGAGREGESNTYLTG